MFYSQPVPNQLQCEVKGMLQSLPLLILKGGAQEHPGQAQETALEGPQQVILSLHENPVPVLAWVPGS